MDHSVEMPFTSPVVDPEILPPYCPNRTWYRFLFTDSLEETVGNRSHTFFVSCTRFGAKGHDGTFTHPQIHSAFYFQPRLLFCGAKV